MTPRVVAEVAAKRTVAAFRRRCQACGGEPDIEMADEEFSDRVRLDAHCHGSHSIFIFDKLTTARDAERSLDGLRRWLRDLFAEDASPDMMELLAYNAGRLPEGRP